MSLGLSAAVLLSFAAHAAAGPATKTVKIAASASPWAVARSTFAIRGTVAPHPPGLVVTLQQQQGTGWFSVGDRPVRSNGMFTFIAEPSKLGLATYRVITSKGSGYAGSSARVPVRVLHWAYVTSIESFAYIRPISGNLTTDPIVSSGARYEHPVALDPGCYNQWSGSAWIDYLLQRQYQLFSTTIGLDDQAPAGATATYAVIGGDGKKLATGSLVRGKATKIQVSVGGEYRLRLWINVPDPSNAAGCSTYFPHVVFGDAALLGP